MNRTKNYKKKYVSKRRVFKRVPRGIRSGDTVSVKVEYYDSLRLPVGGSDYVFINGNQWHNVPTCLQGSTSFTSMTNEYARYKITGIVATVTKVIGDNGLTAVGNVLPSGAIAFYPQNTAIMLGDGPLYNDQKFAFEAYARTSQSKYWRFKDNYFDASAGGYGTWNSVSSYTTLSGQFSVANIGLFNTTTTTNCFLVKFTFYVTFATKSN